MIRKLNNHEILQDYQLFLQNFPTPPALPLEYFHPVQFPVVIAEAKVVLREKQDYSILSLLILRLFDAGITDPEAIQSISGMSLATIQAYIKKEQLILEHIDPSTNKLTKAGKETLKNNESLDNGASPECSQYYDSVLRVQIDPMTASLIPQYLERKGKCFDDILPNEEAGDFLLPRESAPMDKAFERRLNDRLLHDINESMEDLVDNDAIKNGNLLEHMDYLKPVRIFYRWGYLAKFAGMRVPMIVFTGKMAVEDFNTRSLAEGKKNAYVALPVVLAESDNAYLERNGILLQGVWVRSNSCFEYLLDAIREISPTLPDFSSNPDVPGQPADSDSYESEDTYAEAVPEEPDDLSDEEFADEAEAVFEEEEFFENDEVFEDDEDFAYDEDSDDDEDFAYDEDSDDDEDFAYDEDSDDDVDFTFYDAFEEEEDGDGLWN